MKPLISYVPKRYQPYVTDFHKEYEPESYWLSLNPNGKYILFGYYSDHTIHEDTITEVLNVLRTYIKEI